MACRIKLIILAQPKSASTSLMVAMGEITGLSSGQQFYTPLTKMTRLEKRLTKTAGKIFSLAGSSIQCTRKAQEAARLCAAYPATDYGILSRAHSDVCDFVGDRHALGILQHEIHKQHFPPTKWNKNLLREIPKAVLVQDIDETLESYLRVPKTGDNAGLQERIETSAEFRELLKAELARWQNGWIKEVKESANGIVLSFDEVVQSPSGSIARILETMGWQGDMPVGDYELPKQRYYR